MTADDSDANREVARTALEQVCSRGDMTLAPKCYAEDFADHVGTLEYHGLGGVEQSTAVYRALFDDLAFNVVDQVAEGDRVASRFLVTGSNRGRTLNCRASPSAACEMAGSSRTTRRSIASSCSSSWVSGARCLRRRGCSALYARAVGAEPIAIAGLIGSSRERVADGRASLNALHDCAHLLVGGVRHRDSDVDMHRERAGLRGGVDAEDAAEVGLAVDADLEVGELDALARGFHCHQGRVARGERAAHEPGRGRARGAAADGLGHVGA
jgi:hypothetical protein